MKRGYLLPEGCKDLIDVLKLKFQPEAELPPIYFKPNKKAAGPVVPILGEILVPEMMTVRELADALKQKPFYIIADLMEMGVFANGNQKISFDLIARIAQKHGYL